MTAASTRADRQEEQARVFSAIVDGDEALSLDNYAVLSDVDAVERERIRRALGALDGPARFAFIDRLIAAALETPLLDFSPICLDCLEDEDAAVRAVATGGLAEYEGADLIAVLLRLAADDPDDGVRSEAALALGPVALRAELGRLLPVQRERVIDALRTIATNIAEEAAVRAGALASVAVISEPWVADLIYAAFDESEPLLRLGALQAMGRTADAYWLPTLIDAMTAIDEDERAAAAMAAGEIGDDDAVIPLAELLDDESLEVVAVAAEALGEIGGPEALEQLQPHATHPDPEVRDAVQTALSAAEFTDDPLGVSQ